MLFTKVAFLVVLALLSTSQADFLGARRARGRSNFIQRGSRELAGYSGGGQAQYGQAECGGEKETGAGVDFSGCSEEPETGFCCVEKEECIDSLEKDTVLECTHKNVEQCHYTYVTEFVPSQEEVCDENFEKICSITFKQQAYNETVQKCYTPVEKVCNGQGPEECKTVYETSCSTKYVEKQPGKFVGDTKCEKLPTELCGAGCSYQEAARECHDKVVVSVVDVPEEVCDLNPQKTCRYATKLLPQLRPKHECTIVPKETCQLRFTSPRPVKKMLMTKWCLDPAQPEPGQSYQEENAPVLGSGSAPQSYGLPPPSRQPQTGYSAPASATASEGYYAPSEGYASGSSSPSQSYGAPAPSRQPQTDYSSPAEPQTGYSAPASAPAGESYYVPSEEYPGGTSSAAQSYGVPEQRRPQTGYSAPAGESGGPAYTEAGSYDLYEDVQSAGDIYAVRSAPIPAGRDYSSPGRTGRIQRLMHRRFPRSSKIFHG